MSERIVQASDTYSSLTDYFATDDRETAPPSVFWLSIVRLSARFRGRRRNAATEATPGLELKRQAWHRGTAQPTNPGHA
jgi:hypothetical protein